MRHVRVCVCSFDVVVVHVFSSAVTVLFLCETPKQFYMVMVMVMRTEQSTKCLYHISYGG